MEVIMKRLSLFSAVLLCSMALSQANDEPVPMDMEVDSTAPAATTGSTAPVPAAVPGAATTHVAGRAQAPASSADQFAQALAMQRQAAQAAAQQPHNG